MKGARRIHGIISWRSERLPLWGFLELRNLLQTRCPIQCRVGERGWKQTNRASTHGLDLINLKASLFNVTHFFLKILPVQSQLRPGHIWPGIPVLLSACHLPTALSQKIRTEKSPNTNGH